MVAPARHPTASLPAPGIYQTFVPKEGEHLVVQFPGETIRCPVQKVVGDNAVLVKLDTPPMSRTHNFRHNDILGARRRIVNGRDVWEAQNDRDFLAEQARMTPARKVAPVEVKKVAEKKTAKKKAAR